MKSYMDKQRARQTDGPTDGRHSSPSFLRLAHNTVHRAGVTVHGQRNPLCTLTEDSSPIYESSKKNDELHQNSKFNSKRYKTRVIDETQLRTYVRTTAII